MSSISHRSTFRHSLTKPAGNCTGLVTSKGAIFVSSFGTQQGMSRPRAMHRLGGARRRSWARNARRFQVVQQRPGVFQVGGIEPFREPVVDLREKIARFAVPVLIAPDPTKARCSAKFERECALPLGRLDRL